MGITIIFFLVISVAIIMGVIIHLCFSKPVVWSLSGPGDPIGEPFFVLMNPFRKRFMTGTKIIILLLITLVSACCHDQSPEEVEQRIKKSDGLVRVNLLCLNMPKPNGFRFVEKQIKGNSLETSIAFFYKFDAGREAIENFFVKSLTESGWERDSDWALAFKKDAQTITIERTGNSSANYAVSCSETF
jgi:hypothetical protein